MSPASIWRPPNHSTAMLDAFMTSMTVGNMSAMSLPALSETSNRASFATSNRSASRRSRTNARITRMPVICSRSTALMPSIFFCICRK